MRLPVGLALVGVAVAGCGGGDAPPDDASVIACVREAGARVERGEAVYARRDGLVPRGTRQLLAATWQNEAGAIVFRAEDAEAAERAEEDLRRIARAFDAREDQLKRDGVFLTLLGPARLPSEDDAVALAGCLS